MIPDFDERGVLPPGIHTSDWGGFVTRFGFSAKRQWLLGGLKAAATVLGNARCTCFYVDGSFVTSKQEPGDYDACWETNGVDFNLIADQRILHPVLAKQVYRGDLFPAHATELSSGYPFVEFFQQDRDGNPKGIVALDIKEVAA